MTANLRSRRRQKTADDIQLVTLHLAKRHGFESVTTGMIAEAAGMSVRTFFNYYTNKEAAAVGVFRDFQDEDVAAFANGRGMIASDLEALIQTHLYHLSDRRQTVRAVIALTQDAPALQLRHLEALHRLHGRLVQILAARLPEADRKLLDMLAEMTIAVVRQAVHSWTGNDNLPLAEAVDAAFTHLRQAVSIL